MGARFYSPGTGRFTGRDPIGGGNLYAYCGNNSINNIDPQGYYYISKRFADRYPNYKKIMREVYKSLDKIIKSEPASAAESQDIYKICRHIKKRLGSSYEGTVSDAEIRSDEGSITIALGDEQGLHGYYLGFGNQVNVASNTGNRTTSNVVLHELMHMGRLELSLAHTMDQLSHGEDETYIYNWADYMIPPFLSTPPQLPDLPNQY